MPCSCVDGWIDELPCSICNTSDPPRLPADFVSHVYPPKERGSIRSVTVESEPGRSFMCEVRTLPKSGLRPGDLVWVEFGAYWMEIQGVNTRQPGTWRQCIVLPNEVSTAEGVHVRLSPRPSTEPCQ